MKALNFFPEDINKYDKRKWDNDIQKIKFTLGLYPIDTIRIRKNFGF